MATRRRGRQWRRLRPAHVVGVVVVTLLIGVAVGALGGAMRDESTEATTTTTTERVELSASAQELVDLLDLRDETTYHARYQGSSPEAGAVMLETWQDAPLARQDSEVQAEGQTVRTSTLLLESSEVRCTRIGDAPWTCQEEPIVDRRAADPLGAIRDRLGDGTVTASDAQIAGAAVRCFRFAIDASTNELCLRPESGIPVTVRSGESLLQLVELEDEVDQAVFEPPADPTRN